MVSPLHIGVLAFPFGTHAGPLLTLVQRLGASAPWIQFSFFNTATSNDKIFNARRSGSYENIKVYNVWDGKSEGFFGSHFEAVGLFLKASPGNFEKVIGEAEEETGLEICCFITDAFLWFACDLAERKGVPWVAFWTAPSCSLSAHVYTQEIVKAGGLSSTDFAETAEEEKTVRFIPGLEMVRFSDLPPEIFLDKNPSPFALTINIMVQKLPKSTAVVINSFEEIDPVITNYLKSKFQHFLNIGPSILSSPKLTSPDDKTVHLSAKLSKKRVQTVGSPR
ncbi:Anthocyanidin 3-O-glucosyltransferase [Handroanthus impetiginosus]|uniref:Anthocyanidin 3-O-glucosyltransferase n=1 Tax=Handroanthus impetiginosus TaxID=429701 RepID=A0A2G9HSU4_9LAMI|nr:Anthocyanidin 3-O-glucosyltransferase [Handroanthus impetiginosus]